jgi:hypothetical protein
MRTPTAVSCTIALLAGCALAEPPVPGGWTTYNDMRVYYRRNAWEWEGRCGMPYLDGVLESEVVDETPERLDLLVTYYWRDQVGDDTGDGMFPFGGTDRCKGIEHRTFSFEKLDDDTLKTVGMDGLQKGGKVPSLF